MREYLQNGQLVAWATNHPHFTVAVQQRNGHHPYVHAQYLTGQRKSIHQVSVKNYDSWNEVEDVVEMLSNRSGRKITKLIKPVLTDTPSIQGVWTPFLNLQHESPFDIEIIDGAPKDDSSKPSQGLT